VALSFVILVADGEIHNDDREITGFWNNMDGR
jgi:hypothetical protein